MIKKLIILGLSIAVFIVYPYNANSDIILTDYYREINAGISITYTKTTWMGTSTVTETSNPDAKTFNSSGAWNQDISASVSRPNPFPDLNSTTFQAWATQNSSIILNTSTNTLNGTGSGGVYFDNNASNLGTYSIFELGFTIGSGNYSYNFDVSRIYYDWFGPRSTPVSTGFGWSGDFTPNSTGVIGPSDYALWIRFDDVDWTTVNVLIPPSSFTYTPYEFNFVLEPYAGDAPAVPLPPTVLLLGSGLLSLAGWRRFRKG